MRDDGRALGVTGVDRVRLRPTVSGWLFGSAVMPCVEIVALTSALVAVNDSSVGARAVAATVSLACFAILAADWKLAALELGGAGLTYRRLFRSASIAWSDLIALQLRWDSGRTGTGYRMLVVGAPSPTPVRHWVPLLRREALPLVESYVEEHGIDLPVNPVEPWRDRLGTWHGELHQFDPLESIRSIRRAAVGPWEISVVLSGSTFRAVTKNAQDGSVARESPRRDQLAAAIEDAVAQVRIAQAEA